eukprot:UN28633
MAKEVELLCQTREKWEDIITENKSLEKQFQQKFESLNNTSSQMIEKERSLEELEILLKKKLMIFMKEKRKSIKQISKFITNTQKSNKLRKV